MSGSTELAVAKQKRESKFFRKGVTLGLVSGVLYGIYGACLLAATSSGEWAAWYGLIEGLPGYGWYADGSSAIITNTVGAYAVPMTFVLAVLILGALGSGLNDFMSALSMLVRTGVRGKIADVGRSIRTKPGFVLIICALIGGPIASTCYMIALIMAGPIATPISALCPAVGAIIGRVLFKQELNARMVVGILICVTASFMIGSTAFGGLEVDTMFLIGLGIAFISALGWGIEGSVGGFGTTVVDNEVAITIRQLVSSFTTLFILLPTMFIVAGHLGLYPQMLVDAIQGPIFNEGTFQLANPLIFFIIAGTAAGVSWTFWYKGNSMVGAALGMACNGGFSFWVPFVTFLVCGLYLGWGYNAEGVLDPATGYVLYPIQWAAAIVMVIGIFLIAVNPLDWFKKKKEA